MPLRKLFARFRRSKVSQAAIKSPSTLRPPSKIKSLLEGGVKMHKNITLHELSDLLMLETKQPVGFAHEYQEFTRKRFNRLFVSIRPPKKERRVVTSFTIHGKRVYVYE